MPKPMRIHWLFNELRQELVNHQSRETVQGEDKWLDIEIILKDVDRSHHAFYDYEQAVLARENEYNDAA